MPTSSPPVDLSELRLRFCALEQEALLALDPPIYCEAFPRWQPVKAETFPYWLNRVPTFAAETGADDYGEEGANYVYTVNGLLVVAHTTADLTGENEALIDYAAPQVIEYLDARAHLQSEAYPEAMAWLRRASFVTGGITPAGLSVAGVACQGVAFQWRCEFVKPIEQAYL